MSSRTTSTWSIPACRPRGGWPPPSRRPGAAAGVCPGVQAGVRLPASKQRLVPYLHGEVAWVAADVTTNEQTRQQYYRAYILIDREQLEKLPNVFLTPGMPVEAHVQIGERSFFRYMTQPIRDSFTRASREQSPRGRRP